MQDTNTKTETQTETPELVAKVAKQVAKAVATAKKAKPKADATRKKNEKKNEAKRKVKAATKAKQVEAAGARALQILKDKELVKVGGSLEKRVAAGLANTIIKLRRERGLTGRALSMVLGIPATSVAHMEAGNRGVPRITTFIEMAHRLNLKPSSFLDTVIKESGV